MKDRGGVRGALWRGPPIEPGIEDGFDRAIGPGADLDGALAAASMRAAAERADETHRCRDRRGSPARDVACLPGFAVRAAVTADLAGVFPDALDRPAGVARRLDGMCSGTVVLLSSLARR